MLCMKHSTGFAGPDLFKKAFASLGSLHTNCQICEEGS